MHRPEPVNGHRQAGSLQGKAAGGDGDIEANPEHQRRPRAFAIRTQPEADDMTPARQDTIAHRGDQRHEGNRHADHGAARARAFPGLLIAATLAAGMSVHGPVAAAYAYSVDFDSVTDLTDAFDEVVHNFDGVYSNGNDLWFNRPGPQSQWSSTTPNIYAFTGDSGSGPMRFSAATASVQQYLNYPSSIRGIFIATGFYLFDPDLASGALGAIDNPYAWGRFYQYEWAAVQGRELHVADGDVGDQTDSGESRPFTAEGVWTVVSMAFEPSAGGGYDIMQVVDGSKGSFTFSDHSPYDLSNVALGLSIWYGEFMDGSGYTAYVDDFAIGAGDSTVPAPGTFWLLALGLIRLALGPASKGHRREIGLTGLAPCPR
ncbi:MAG: hypothetical protein LJE69_06500 [Thiohalocapsa sp.]|uniref:hypothetical protein n=1 Tax=Thiohalocapsa sp. TaxID=2497641 RepID=UPI0025FBA6DE|nr:hypothetical protein [Thiohalocapsa sp.]MCG6940882.1 hypothetical protein [Thiohalocapsa sp.]